MLGALQTLYLVTVPSNDNNDHFPFFDGFIIEGAFDHELCVHLLATGKLDTCCLLSYLMTNLHHNSTHAVCFHIL